MVISDGLVGRLGPLGWTWESFAFQLARTPLKTGVLREVGSSLTVWTYQSKPDKHFLLIIGRATDANEHLSLRHSVGLLGGLLTPNA